MKPFIGNTLNSEDKYDGLYCGTRTILSQNWSSVTSSPHNLRFISYLHVVHAAKAAVHLQEEKLGEHTVVAGPYSNRERPSCSVYVHGAGIKMTEAARNAALSKLEFSRHDNSVLILHTEEQDRLTSAKLTDIDANFLLTMTLAVGACHQMDSRGFQPEILNMDSPLRGYYMRCIQCQRFLLQPRLCQQHVGRFW